MASLPETIPVTERLVSCDGGGALGHPRVYLTLPAATNAVVCPYCDRHFVFTTGTASAAGH